MSCLDVMYPAYGHYAYTPAFINSLQAPAALTSPHCRDLMDTSRGPEGMSGVPGSSSSSSSTASSSSSSYTPAAARTEEAPKDKRGSPEAEYLTSRCVLFTYYQGDISSVVDEHFSRALSSYMDGEGKRRAAEPRSPDTPSPGSRRSFPPSFWDSSYSSPQSRSHGETPSFMDPYASGLHPGLAHPHPHHHHHPHAPDSWGYPQAQPYGPPRPLHELYSPSALEPHYGPLLVSSVRPAHLPALQSHYEVSKLEPGAAWPGLLPAGEVALNMDAGLQHKKGKELYWF